MDVRLRFGREPKEYNDRTCVIVIDVNNISIGMIVDIVSDVITIPEHDTVDPPMMQKDSNNRFLKKIGKVENDVKLILNCEKLLSEDEIMDIKEVL